MATFRESQIEELTPFEADGVNKVFTTPTPYLSGSLRVYVNGVLYPPDDDFYGFTELGPTSIEMVIAPRAGDKMQAFYKDSAGVFGDDVVTGSPFADGEC